MDRITHVTHNAWVSRPRSWVNLNIAPRGSQRMDRIKYAQPSASGFLKQVSKFKKKLDVLCPGRLVSWTFCNWTFGNWTFCNWTLCNWTFCGCTPGTYLPIPNY
jgi:hypothetical protein